MLVVQVFTVSCCKLRVTMAARQQTASAQHAMLKAGSAGEKQHAVQSPRSPEC